MFVGVADHEIRFIIGGVRIGVHFGVIMPDDDFSGGDAQPERFAGFP